MLKQWPALLLITLLAACGGGGGGGGAAPTPPGPATGPALSFSPASVNATLTAGVSSTVSVAASVNRPAELDGAVFGFIVDPGGAILPDAQLQQRSGGDYLAVLHTAPTLAVGGHQGSLTVKLCRDSACAAQYPGSPMALPYNLQVAPVELAPFSATPLAALAASVPVGDMAPAPIYVTIAADGRSWSASASAAWLKPTKAEGSGSGPLGLVFDPAGLAQGKYDALLTLSASDGQKLTLAASLTVLPSAFHVDSGGVSFSAVNGATIAPKAVKFNLDGNTSARWSAASDSDWLRVTPGAGLLPGQTTLYVSSGDTMASGKYLGKLILTAPGVNRAVPVELTLIKPSLKLSASSLALGGPYGRDFSPLSLAMNSNTGANTFPWTASALPDWVGANNVSGVVGADPVTLTFTPQPAKLPLGTQTATINLSAKVNGDTPQASVMLNVKRDQRKLLLSDTGVALSWTPEWSRLTRTLTVSDNYAKGATWTAAADQPWLSVAAGAAGLTLTANPAALAANSLNLATVKLTPADADVVAPENITVALWKGGAAPATSRSVNQFYSNLLADPVRPLVYVHNGSTAIDIYNVYTAQKTGSIALQSSALGQMAVSADGSSLFVYDLLNRNVQQFNLATLGKVASFPTPTPASAASRLQVIRPNGVEMLLQHDGTATMTALAAVRLVNITLPAGELSSSTDGKRLYVQDQGASTNTLQSFSIDYTAASPNNLLIARLYGGLRSGNSDGQDLALSRDGGRLYTASLTPGQCVAINPLDLSVVSYLPAFQARPNNVEVGSDGRVYCGGAIGGSPTDIWQYDANGALIRQFRLAPPQRQLLPRQMAVSGDGMMLIGLVDDATLVFLPVGP